MEPTPPPISVISQTPTPVTVQPPIISAPVKPAPPSFSKVFLLVSLGVVALISVVGLAYYLISNSTASKAANFNQRVSTRKQVTPSVTPQPVKNSTESEAVPTISPDTSPETINAELQGIGADTSNQDFKTLDADVSQL
ncbi:hypothetical protein HGA88_03480 [Candidatus Roizmanbacteria bacterium]|nr:hypothetical protein [Candidatus Roizmanbacteria bacterium]